VTAWVAPSSPHGLLLLDDTGVPKPWRSSVGVARQSSGPLGQGANGQVVVRAHDVADEPASSAPVHWPLPARLYLPEPWAATQVRRAKVRVPMAGTVQPKPELALALGAQARTWGVPFATVGADAGDGDHPTCLQGLEDRHVGYVVGVRSTFGVRLPEEGQAAALLLPPCPRRRGQPPRPALCGSGRARGPPEGPLADDHLARA
jgi:SRSO17 transposase